MGSLLIACFAILVRTRAMAIPHGILAIDGAARSRYEFDPLSQINIEREITSCGALVIRGIVDAVAINCNQYTRIEIPWQTQASYTQIIILIIIRAMDPGKTG